MVGRNRVRTVRIQFGVFVSNKKHAFYIPHVLVVVILSKSYANGLLIWQHHSLRY